MGFAGLPKGAIQPFDLKFELDEESYRMRTYVINSQHDDSPQLTGNEKPTLVMMHGYYASSVHFFKCLKGLVEHFRIVLVD